MKISCPWQSLPATLPYPSTGGNIPVCCRQSETHRRVCEAAASLFCLQVGAGLGRGPNPLVAPTSASKILAQRQNSVFNAPLGTEQGVVGRPDSNFESYNMARNILGTSGAPIPSTSNPSPRYFCESHAFCVLLTCFEKRKTDHETDQEELAFGQNLLLKNIHFVCIKSHKYNN